MAKSLYCPENLIFSDMLRLLRERKQIRQTDLAKVLGQSQATVSKVESGMRRLDIIELRAWLAALDTEFKEFVDSLEEELGSQGITHTLSAHEMQFGFPKRSPR